MPTEQFFADSPALRRFAAAVQAAIRQDDDPGTLVEALQAPFGELLAAQDWLPDEFAQPDASSGMGGGIGQYLLYRSEAPTFTIFSLVVPSGAMTPVHDHLAWGLVGLYQGAQREDVYALIAGDPDRGAARLELLEERDIARGDFYPILPPDNDIHRVTTTSAEPSISIHLLGNDTGCVLRHSYDPAAETAQSFRSGYSNAPCEQEQPAADD
jgi:predicted metal-dependent enzyme (double-stranded beta helix superfamily)